MQSPALFQNIFKFCTFLPKFSNILPFFALFKHFLVFWCFFFWKSHACPYFLEYALTIYYQLLWLWAIMFSEFPMVLFIWMCTIFILVVFAVLFLRTFFLYVSVFFVNRLKFPPTHLSQMDQRVPLYPAHYKLILSFQL